MIQENVQMAMQKGKKGKEKTKERKHRNNTYVNKEKRS